MSKFIRFLQEYEVGKDLFLFSNSGTTKQFMKRRSKNRILFIIFTKNQTNDTSAAGGVIVLDFLLRNPNVGYGIKGHLISLVE